MASVLLVTFNLMPEGEPGGAALTAALTERGIDSGWVCWDDPDVDWAGADLVAVRSTWDYHRRFRAFLDWARDVERVAPLLHGAEVFAWNADKAYLVELSERLPVVPTLLIDDATLVSALSAGFQRWGKVVVKPRLGAGGRGVVVVGGLDDWSLFDLSAGPWVMQPFVESVRTEGETSIYVLDGRAVAQVDKSVAGDEVRVHEVYGGSSRPVAIDPVRARIAEDAVRTAAELCGADLAYARLDLLRWEDEWVVSEVELIEPGLYLDVAPEIAGPFADLMVRRLAR